MSTTIHMGHVPAWRQWTGWILSAIPVLAMVASASMKLAHSPQFVEAWVGHFGYPESAAMGIGLVELGCAALYLVPPTRVLGAILVTGYLGGAVATHVRVGEAAFVLPLLLGILAWAGLVLRDERLQDQLPVVRATHGG